MATKFESIRQAIECLATKHGFDLSKVEEVANLKVYGICALFLENDSVPEETKKKIRNQIEAQKGFKVQTAKGELQFVTGPFIDGFDCWVVDPKTRTATRI